MWSVTKMKTTIKKKGKVSNSYSKFNTIFVCLSFTKETTFFVSLELSIKNLLKLLYVFFDNVKLKVKEIPNSFI